MKDHKLYQEGPRFLVTGEPPFLGKVDITMLPEGCRQELPRAAMSAKLGEIEPVLNLYKIIPEPTAITNSYHRLMRVTRSLYKAVALMRAKRVPVDPQSWTREKVEKFLP